MAELEPSVEIPIGAQERTLLLLINQTPFENRRLRISLAHDMVKWKGTRAHPRICNSTPKTDTICATPKPFSPDTLKQDEFSTRVNLITDIHTTCAKLASRLNAVKIR